VYIRGLSDWRKTGGKQTDSCDIVCCESWKQCNCVLFSSVLSIMTTLCHCDHNPSFVINDHTTAL